MSVKPTSIRAYLGINQDGTAKKQRGVIYLFIENSKSIVTRQEITDGTGIGINAVSGRVTGMLNAGVIFVTGLTKCSITGHEVEALCTTADKLDSKVPNRKVKKHSGKELTILLHRIIDKACKPKAAYGGKPSTYNTINCRDDDFAELKRLSGYKD